MDNTLLIFLLLSLTLITSITQIILFLFLTGKKSSKTSESDKPLEEKSAKILHDAIQKANKILVNAELKGIEYISRQKLESEKLFGSYKEQMEGVEGKLLERFSQSMLKMEKAFTEYMSQLEIKLHDEELKNQAVFHDKVTAMINNSQSALANFIVEINSKIKKQIDDELSNVKAEIEKYKQRRIDVINQNIVDILEKTLEETLGKKLSLDEHSEIILQALEQAKTEQGIT